MFPSSVCRISHFTFMSLVYLKLTLVYGVRDGSTFIFFQTGTQLPQHHLFKRLPQMRCHIYDIFPSVLGSTFDDFGSIPLVYLSLGELAAGCFNYKSFLGYSHTWQGQSSLVDFTFWSFSWLLHVCFPIYTLISTCVTPFFFFLSVSIFTGTA